MRTCHWIPSAFVQLLPLQFSDLPKQRNFDMTYLTFWFISVQKTHKLVRHSSSGAAPGVTLSSPKILNVMHAK